MRKPESVGSASSSSPFSSSTTSSTMAPKKKPGAANHPSTSRAPSPTTANIAGNEGTHEVVDVVGGVVDAGGIVTTIPATEAKAGGAGEGQHQHIPMATLLEVRVGRLLYLHPLSSLKGTTAVAALVLRRTATLRPPATGATVRHTPPPEQANPATVPNGATGPQAPGSR